MTYASIRGGIASGRVRAMANELAGASKRRHPIPARDCRTESAGPPLTNQARTVRTERACGPDKAQPDGGLAVTFAL